MSAPETASSAAPALTVVIPAFNEEGSVGPVVRGVLEECPGAQVIVVDDGSADGTGEEARRAGAEVIVHYRNRGYGAALKTGVAHARADRVITFDSDGQHNPADILRVSEELAGHDLVIGARDKTIHSSLWRMPGKWLLGWLAEYLTGVRIPDLNSGLRGFHRERIAAYAGLCSDRFSFSTTSTLVYLMEGRDVKYIPIEIRKRQGKSTVNLRTGFDTIILILQVIMLFSPLRIFLPPSLLLFSVGVMYLSFDLAERNISDTSVLLILIAMLLFFFGLVADQISQLRRDLRR